MRLVLGVGIVLVALGIGALRAQTQECAQDRRVAAVQFLRQVNTAQAREKAIASRYASSLAVTPPVDFEWMMKADSDGYLVMLREEAGACAAFSNQSGIIYEGRAIR